MAAMIGKAFLVGALTLVADAASSPRQLYERAACNRDNLFRYFIDTRYSVQASDFCSGLSASTVTVATTVATATTTVEAEVTLDAVTSTATSTTTVFTATIPTATTTTTLGVEAVAKRDSDSSPPKCMTNGVTYPASRITSACSCIDVPAATVSVTYTASTETMTEIDYNRLHNSFGHRNSLGYNLHGNNGRHLHINPRPPYPTNRIINGDFETGNADGWSLEPTSWQGQISSSWNIAPPYTGSKSYTVTGSGDSISYLRQVEPIWLEAGQYNFGVMSTLAKFPNPTAAWGSSAVLEIVNPLTGANKTISLATGGVKTLVAGTLAVPFSLSFDVADSLAGWTEVSFRYLTFSPPTTSIDGVYQQKAA